VNIFVILTSYREAHTIGKAVEQILLPNSDLWGTLRLIVVAPDQQTLSKAKEVCQKYAYAGYTLLQDEGKGKALALNTAVSHIQTNYKVDQEKDVLIFTDGDMYVGEGAIRELIKAFQTVQQQGLVNHSHEVVGGQGFKEGHIEQAQAKLGGIGGHPVSLDDRATQFGYYSHLFCEAAHTKRLKNPQQSDFVPMSGYLYAIKFVDGLFPIPPDVRAEDAYISQKLVDLGYRIGYAPEALAYVRFPKNFRDWVRQKTRSLGGNVQLARVSGNVQIASSNGCPDNLSPKASAKSGSLENSSGIPLSNRKTSRSIGQDLAMLFFPLTFAKTPKEFVWSLVLYPLRLYLWLKIYYTHIFNRYPTGMWERIESTK